MSNAKVILIKGDKRNPEPDEHIIKFPGGSISVIRTTNNEYWAHVDVHKGRVNEDLLRESKIGHVVDSRIDRIDSDISEIECQDDVQHIAIRIKTE